MTTDEIIKLVREECTKACEYRAMLRPLHQSTGEQIMNIEQEHTEFEAWYRLHHGSRDVYGRDASGEYADKQVQGAFNVWQARAALAAQDKALLRQALDALAYWLEVGETPGSHDIIQRTHDALQERLK